MLVFPYTQSRACCGHLFNCAPSQSKTCPLLQNVEYKTQLTPMSQMEAGCSRIWELVLTTQNQVGGTPHKPAPPATQPRAPRATPDPKSSTRNTEQWVQWKKLLRRGPDSLE